MGRLLSLLLRGTHSDLTSFFSLLFLGGFLPAAIVLYSLTPKKWKKYALLLISLGFFRLVSGELVLYLLGSILLTWGFGLWLGKIQRNKDAAVKAAPREDRKALKRKFLLRSRWVLGLAAAAHIGGLLTVKYTGFFLRNVNTLFGLELPIPGFVMPIGVSFFTLQAVSYLFDVYRGTQEADGNVLRVGLFLSFFPQIVEGPICRYPETAGQLWNAKGITWRNLTLGLQRILYGLMKKLVVADRLNGFVKGVFTCVDEYQGGVIALAAVCYTVQLYMDFSGAMDAVAGMGQIFGITMPENFRRPFFSRTISEFWSRWHITLGTWFKDYIFYPVTMSGSSKKLTSAARKRLGNHYGPLLAGGVALFCVWLCNGLWHGAAWSFLFFGMYHFVLIYLGSLAAPLVKRVNTRLGLKPECLPYRIAQTLRTCALVVVGELFFRAEGLRAGLRMFRKMVTDFRFDSISLSMLKELRIDPQDFLIVGVTMAIVFVVSLLNERGIVVREALEKKPAALRWAVLYALILYILIFGAYGKGYVPVNPMYANF